MMKKTVLFLISVLLTVGVFAQKPSLTKAYNSFYDKDYDKAKVQIDLCAADEKLSAKAQTWLYKGNIEFLLANREYSAMQKDESYKTKYPDAPEAAFDAFERALSLNPKVEALDMMPAQDALKQLYPYLLISGVNSLLEKDYHAAKRILEKGIQSYEMDKPQYPMNGDLYYYYAYTLEMLGDTVEMLRNYRKALDDGTKNPYVFSKLLDVYKRNNDRQNAEKVIQSAKKSSIDEVNMRMLETDYAFWSGDSARASALLGSIDESRLNSADELVNVSNFYIKEKRYKDADKLLRRANAIEPGNFVVLYNLGVCNYRLSEEYFELQNRLSLKNSAKEEIDNAKNISSEYLLNAAGFFEMANELQPGDLNLLYTLRSIYVRQQDKDKEDKIESQIKKLENK